MRTGVERERDNSRVQLKPVVVEHNEIAVWCDKETTRALESATGDSRSMITGGLRLRCDARGRAVGL